MKAFYKEHKILSYLFIFSLFMIIKNSSIPYIIKPCRVIEILFDLPHTVFFQAIASVVDIFTAAYVSSLIFYIFIEYIPEKKREKTTNRLIGPKLDSLYMNMSDLYSLILFELNIEAPRIEDSKEVIANLSFSKKTKKCKKSTIVDGIEKGSAYTQYNLLQESDQLRNNIIYCSQQISDVPSFFYCTPELQDIISEIQISDFLKYSIPKKDDQLYSFEDVSPITSNMYNDFLAFVTIKEKLKKYVTKRIEFKYSNISDEEVAENEKKEEEYFQTHPREKEIIQKLMLTENR